MCMWGGGVLLTSYMSITTHYAKVQIFLGVAHVLDCFTYDHDDDELWCNSDRHKAAWAYCSICMWDSKDITIKFLRIFFSIYCPHSSYFPRKLQGGAYQYVHYVTASFLHWVMHHCIGISEC